MILYICWTEQTMEVEPAYLDFITCDRTGRRNAVTDIEGESSTLATSDLTKDLAQMDLKTQGECRGSWMSFVTGAANTRLSKWMER
uniref:cAMP-dependent protein kinase inhibitor gamma n=1 Tax=Erpetoichthys calabaricus TaxID=27687 RepID=A0A8C4SHT9_ERPCA